MIRAFEMVALDITSIVFAESAGKARAATVRTANDVGFTVTFPDVVVRRAPDFDCALMSGGGTPLTETCYVSELLVLE